VNSPAKSPLHRTNFNKKKYIISRMALELIYAVGRRAFDIAENITTIISPGYEEDSVILHKPGTDEEKALLIWLDSNEIRVRLNYGRGLCVISSGIQIRDLPESIVTRLFSGDMALGDVVDLPAPFNPQIHEWHRGVGSKPIIVGEFKDEYLKCEPVDFNWPDLSPIIYPA